MGFYEFSSGVCDLRVQSPERPSPRNSGLSQNNDLFNLCVGI